MEQKTIFGQGQLAIPKKQFEPIINNFSGQFFMFSGAVFVCFKYCSVRTKNLHAQYLFIYIFL